MARGLTKLVGANALSGTLPSSVIANSTFDNITALPTAVPTGKPVLLSTATASSSASIEFTSGIDSTYDVYKFEFINCSPESSQAEFNFNMSTDSGSNYNVTKTTTFFYAYNYENASSTSLAYNSSFDLAQSTSDQTLSYNVEDNADSSVSGELYLFAPSSTTYVKHFICTTQAIYEDSGSNPVSFNDRIAGYGNTTSAINACIFRYSSGNFDGTIKMYGISA